MPPPPITYLKALELLGQGKRLTKYDLAEAVPCDQRTAQRVLAKVHKEHPEIRIVAWAVSYRFPLATYGLGDKDVPRPKPLSYAAKAKRRRKDPEVTWDEMMKKRSKRLKEKACPTHPLTQMSLLLLTS